MENRGVHLLTPLAVLGFIAWLVFQTRSGPASVTPPQAASPATAGDAVRERCAAPIAWRIAGVDPRFGLSVAEVQASARQAAQLWSSGAARPLFVHDSVAGMPIRLVYDDRQARTEQQVRAEALGRHAGARLAADASDLERARQEHAQARLRNLDAWAQHDAEVTAHNALVRRWNANGDVPADTLAALVRAEARLRGQELELSDAARALRSVEEELRTREWELEDRQAALDAEGARLARAFPPTEVEAGTYLEAEVTDAGGRRVVLREIRVFRVRDRQALLNVLAHELGHALGLAHVDAASAVMSPRRGDEEPGALQLHAEDRAALQALCR